MSGRRSVLFTGYAPVHFACFLPLYERLRARGDMDVHLSGGLRTETPEGPIYDLEGMYRPFGIDASDLVPVEALGDLDVDLLFAANTKMIAPRSATRRIQIFHGISFRNKAVREENASADHYFIVGPYMRRAFAASGILPDGDRRALPIGFMKTDRLLDGSLDRRATLEAHGMTGDRPVVLYAPTGQKDNSLETMGEEVLRRLAEAGSCDILVKPHDHPKRPIDWFGRLASLENEHLRVSREPDVIRLLHAADLLITDASSVSSEFALLDRPMVFLDVPKLIARATSATGSMVDLESWGRRCGRIVERPEDVADAVDRALSEPGEHAAIRREMARDLFFNPGRATDAAIAWIDGVSSRSLAPLGDVGVRE